MRNQHPEKSEADQSAENLAGCLIGLVLLPAKVFFGGVVLHLLWGWFLTPAFDVPSPGIAVCIGIDLMVSVLTPKRLQKSGTMLDCCGEAASSALADAILLGIGWIVHLFV